MKSKSKLDKYLSFEYSENLKPEIESLQPMLLEAIELKRKTHKSLDACMAEKLVNYPGVKVKYIGNTRDPETGKKFATYKVTKDEKKVSKQPAAQPKKEPQKEYFIDAVRGVRYSITKDGKGNREVMELRVWSSSDLTNNPEERAKQIENALDELLDRGYFLCEEDALADAAVEAGRILSKLAHKLEYSSKPPCKRCTRTAIMAVEDLLAKAREGYFRHQSLVVDLDIKKPVGVFPNGGDMDEYTVDKDGAFVLKNPPTVREVKPKIEVGVIKPEDLPEDLRKGLSKFIESRRNK